MADLIAIEAVDEVVVVRIQRPPANALEPGLLAAGAEVVERLRERRPAAIVLTGSGDFFSGGVDLKLAPTLSEDEQRAMVGGINRLFYRLVRPAASGGRGGQRPRGRRRPDPGPVRRPPGRLAAGDATGSPRSGSARPIPGPPWRRSRAELEPGAARRLMLGAELVGAELALGLGLIDELAEPERRVRERPRRRPAAGGPARRYLRDGEAAAARPGAGADARGARARPARRRLALRRDRGRRGRACSIATKRRPGSRAGLIRRVRRRYSSQGPGQLFVFSPFAFRYQLRAAAAGPDRVARCARRSRRCHRSWTSGRRSIQRKPPSRRRRIASST